MENQSVAQFTTVDENTVDSSLIPLLMRQKESEEEGLALGADRFEKRLKKSIQNGTVADQGAAKKLLEVGVEKFSKDLEEVVEEALGKKGPKSAAIKWIRKIGAEKASYITLRQAFSSALTQDTIPTVSRDISKRICDELRFRRLEDQAPELFKYKLSNFATNHYMHRSRSLDSTLKYANIDTSDLELTQAEYLSLGVFLVNRLIESTGLFELDHRMNKGKKTIHLVATQETIEWLSKRNDAMRLLHPVYPAMVIQPLPWSKGKQGGYRFALRGSNHLIRGASKAHRKMIDEVDMPAVYDALNRIQNTEWRINQKVLKVFNDLMEQGGGKAGLPKVEPEPPTPKPVDIETNPKSLRDWKKAEKYRRQDDNKRVLEYLRVNRVREIADTYSKEERLYFPHSLDFRGRIYPIPTGLSPQGDDIQKSLLEFAQGKPLGESGAKYLAIHGANAWGKLPDGRKVSKLTLEERVEAIWKLEEDIQNVASDPLYYTWWMEADDPWVFLAFCFEFGAMRHHEEYLGNYESFISHLPVASDGTCNGLQHFSALLLDEVGAEAVNVTDNQRPHDIYQKVADVVLRKLEETAATDPMALKWLESGLVNRSLCKRPTMTLPYGAKQYGFKDQLITYLKKEILPSKLKVFEVTNEQGEDKVDLHDPCVFMASLIWHSLGDVVVSAQLGMEFFQKYARAISKGDKNPTWIVPGTGFKAFQNAFKQNIVRNVDTVLCGSVYRPATYVDTPEVDPVSAANGVSPNIIHSLDASALMLTVNKAADNGITHFAMVHDSYGTHAADAELLSFQLRQAFYGLYKNDVLGDLVEQFMEQVAEVNDILVASHEGRGRVQQVEFPEVPEKGTLEISKVLISDYFFC